MVYPLGLVRESKYEFPCLFLSSGHIWLKKKVCKLDENNGTCESFNLYNHQLL